MGARPRRVRSPLRGLFAAVRWVLVAAVPLAAVLYAAVPPVRGWVNHEVLAAKQYVAGFFAPDVAVRPTKVQANNELPDHPARFATDLVTNTYWATQDAGPQPILVLDFGRPVRLARVIIRVGDGADFPAWSRPQRLHLVYSTGQTVDLEVKDTPEPQDLELDVGDAATSVEIHVMSSYRSVRTMALALSEIELFERP